MDLIQFAVELQPVIVSAPAPGLEGAVEDLAPEIDFHYETKARKVMVDFKFDTLYR